MPSPFTETTPTQLTAAIKTDQHSTTTVGYLLLALAIKDPHQANLILRTNHAGTALTRRARA